MDSLEECCDLIDYYLVHVEKEKLSQVLRRKVLAEHTYDHRIDLIFETLPKGMGT
jgi:spore maturation protein CgeB